MPETMTHVLQNQLAPLLEQKNNLSANSQKRQEIPPTTKQTHIIRIQQYNTSSTLSLTVWRHEGGYKAQKKAATPESYELVNI